MQLILEINTLIGISYTLVIHKIQIYAKNRLLAFINFASGIKVQKIPEEMQP